MANTFLNQFLYSKHGKLCMIDVKVPIGATGAVGTLGSGAGVSSVVRNSAGVYQINFVDNWNKYINMVASIESPNSGSSILVASAGTVSGTTYVITVVGTTTTAGWVTLGLPVGVTPAVGVAFKATATTTAAGTGAVQVQSVSGIATIEAIGVPTTTLSPGGVGAASSYMIIQCLGATGAGTTTLIPTDPASGSSLKLNFIFSDSSNVSKDFG